LLKELAAVNGTAEPLEILARVTGNGVTDDLARSALWTLIDDGEIELTFDRKLRLGPPG
jgi:hypothetical protein